METLVQKRQNLTTPRQEENQQLINYTKPSPVKTMREILNRYSRGEFVPRVTDTQEPPTCDLQPVEDYRNPLDQQQRVADWLDDFKKRSESPETALNPTNDGKEVQSSSPSAESSETAPN